MSTLYAAQINSLGRYLLLVQTHSLMDHSWKRKKVHLAVAYIENYARGYSWDMGGNCCQGWRRLQKALSIQRSTMLESLVDRTWSCFFDRLCSQSETHTNSYRDNKQIGIANAAGQQLPLAKCHQSQPICPTHRTIESVDQAFKAMLAELDLGEERQAELLRQPWEWKQRVLAERERQQQQRGDGNWRNNDERQQNEAAPSWALERINDWCKHFPDCYVLPLAIQQLEALAATLRTESISWLDQFLNEGGLSLLSRLLDKCHSNGSSAELLALPLLNSIRALLNSTIGRQWVQDSADTLCSVAWALDMQNTRCKVVSLEILSGLCFCAEFGHRAVLLALTQVKELRGERTRFQKLIDDLHREHGNTPRDTERVRLALMSLINALLKGGAAEHSLEFRVHLRHELIMLGLLQELARIRSSASEGAAGSGLDDHLDLFEMMRQEDEQEMQSISGSASPIDFESPSGMADVIAQRLDHTLALSHFISLLQHLLMVPTDERHHPLWHYFDMLLQHFTLQTAMGGLDPAGADPQLSGIGNDMKLNWTELLGRLRTESDCERLERKLHSTEIELAEERKRALELENRLTDLQDTASLASFSRVSEHSASSTSSSPSDPCHSPCFALPPIRLPVGQTPPPPPPSALQLRSGNVSRRTSGVTANLPKKNIPKTGCPLRTLNWTPISQNKIKETIWEELTEEEQKFYKQIDIDKLTEQFMTGRFTDDALSDVYSVGTVGRTLGRHYQQTEQITVLESRRAQNCTIMLSRLKMSHREIRQFLMNMDEHCRLSRDVLEQMLKFVPGRNELKQMQEVLEQRRKSPQALALADRFIWEMGHIPRYEQRLRCLCTIRSFQDRLDELRPAISAICRASLALRNNKRLRQFLALILAVGNVLNEGKRLGNAYGFTLSSLDQICSMRSAHRSDRNLMHFLAEMIEQINPDLLRLKRELTSVLDAARVDRAQLEAELRQLEMETKELAMELTLHRHKEDENNNTKDNAEDSQDSAIVIGGQDLAPDEPTNTESNGNGKQSSKKDANKTTARGICNQQQQQQKKQHLSNDRFVPVVRLFLRDARKQLEELRSEHTEMVEKFAQCVRFFAAEPVIHQQNTNKNYRNNSELLPPVDQLFGPFARCLNTMAECHRALWVEREESEARKRQTLVRTLFLQKRKGDSDAVGTQNQTGRHTVGANVTNGHGGGTKTDFEALVNMLQTGELFSQELCRLRTSVRVTAKPVVGI